MLAEVAIAPPKETANAYGTHSQSQVLFSNERSHSYNYLLRDGCTGSDRIIKRNSDRFFQIY
jgi:hypothetical protein